MKKSFPLLVLLLSGCLSSKVLPTTQDAALAISQEDGLVRLSSRSSAVLLKITGQQHRGDTLFITYKKQLVSARTSALAQPLLPLTEQTRYVKCANRLYRVVKTGNGFQLDQL